MSTPGSHESALALLERLGAPARLLRHAEIVAAVAGRLCDVLARMGVELDRDLVLAGAALHDAGKIEYPDELEGPGSAHECAGERLLLGAGVRANVAQCCRTHGAWGGLDVTLEERVVALADKLWKGRREDELESLVAADVARRLGRDRWQVFGRLDTEFERIAAQGPERLSRAAR